MKQIPQLRSRRANTQVFRSAMLFLIVFSVYVVVISSPLVAAGGAPYFSTQQSPVKNTISAGDQARFLLTVYNYAENDKFKVYTDSDSWEILTDPLYIYQTEYGLSVPTNSSEEFTISLKPAIPLMPGVHKINIFIKSKNRPEFISKETLLITIKSETAPIGEYLPTIRADVSVSSDGLVDPRKTATIYVKLDNLNPLNITDLYIYMESPLFTKDRHVTLGPLEQKTEEFEVSFNPLNAPKKAMIVTTIQRGVETLKIVKSQIEITAYTNLEKDSKVEKAFFKRIYTYKFVNDGNVNRQETILIPTTSFKKYFTKTAPEASITEKDGAPQLTYYLNLKPQEAAEITVTENFRGLIIVILVLALAVVLYYVLRSPLVMRKEVSIIRKPEAGISELKILLYIKNRTALQFSNVKVMDKVPTVAEMQDEFILGTLKPSKVLRNEKKGTFIEWELKTIEPYEERIISYKIKSKLSILGFFNLPPAMIKFLRNGREAKVLSNKVRAVEK